MVRLIDLISAKNTKLELVRTHGFHTPLVKVDKLNDRLTYFSLLLLIEDMNLAENSEIKLH
jgi:hypothetical protein